MPAESWLEGFPGSEPCLDVLYVVRVLFGRPRCVAGHPLSGPAAGGHEIVEQVAGAMVPGLDLRSHRLHDNVVDGARHFRVLEARRGDELATHEPIEIGGRGG